LFAVRRDVCALTHGLEYAPQPTEYNSSGAATSAPEEVFTYSSEARARLVHEEAHPHISSVL